MKALKKLISILLILFFVLNAVIEPLQAEENGIVIIHSLGELPSGMTPPEDESVNRAKLLDALDSGKSDSPMISYTTDIDPATVVLLSEKINYDTHIVMHGPELTPSLTPTISWNPPISEMSEANIIAEFLALGNTGNLSGATTLIPTLEQDVPLPLEKSASIQIYSPVRETKKVSTIQGKVTVNIGTGTIITTESGDIIDTSLIQIAPLQDNKKLQAKTKYEKRMRNRGNKRKGLAEASVEGFQFGLPGTHLIFSRPVEITIPTPNA